MKTKYESSLLSSETSGRQLFEVLAEYYMRPQFPEIKLKKSRFFDLENEVYSVI